jgi:hypothetical protein
MGWSCPPWVKLAPRGEFCPLREMFTPTYNPGVNIIYYLVEWRGILKISPLGTHFNPGANFHPWELKFVPRCEIKNRPLGHCASNLDLYLSMDHLNLHSRTPPSGKSKSRRQRGNAKTVSNNSCNQYEGRKPSCRISKCKKCWRCWVNLTPPDRHCKV